MTAVDHAELKRLAEGATHRSWAAFTDDSGHRPHTNLVSFVPVTDCALSIPGVDKRDPNVAFIAAANPAVVLALLSEIEGLKAERDHPTLSWKSRDPLPPSILAHALSQIAAEGVIEVGERHIHADNLIAMAVDYLRTQAPDSWRPEVSDEDLAVLSQIIHSEYYYGADSMGAALRRIYLALRPQTAESGK